jgi:hypothetical protein
MKPAGDLATYSAWSFLVVLQGKHDVSCRRNARLGVGIEFVELHWVT